MGSGLARIVSVLIAPLALCGGIAVAAAGECPDNPTALGTSRTIVVDPREHAKIGTMDYMESLPLNDHEVVLTFDDGPLPPYTNKVLDILASQCVKATYFIVGAMAKAYPAALRQVYEQGHTIGTHSMTHPIRFRAQSVERGNAQIDDGIAAVAEVLGDPDKVAPFFRFPGFGWTTAAEAHAASRGLMVWGADVPADDWLRVGPREVARRAVQRLEFKGKGILLLHDIHQRTVDALPSILDELKNRGFRVVHVVPAGPERPPTVTATTDWVPNSRRVAAGPAAPIILIAEVQDPEGNGVANKTAAELCALNPPMQEMASRRSMRKHARAIRFAHAEVGQAKAGQIRAGRSRVAHAEAATARQPDIHAMQ